MSHEICHYLSSNSSRWMDWIFAASILFCFSSDSDKEYSNPSHVLGQRLQPGGRILGVKINNVEKNLPKSDHSCLMFILARPVFECDT